MNNFIENNKGILYTLYKTYPNYFELGYVVRQKLNSDYLNKNYPNDYDLGEYINDIFNYD